MTKAPFGQSASGRVDPQRSRLRRGDPRRQTNRRRRDIRHQRRRRAASPSAEQTHQSRNQRAQPQPEPHASSVLPTLLPVDCPLDPFALVFCATAVVFACDRIDLRLIDRLQLLQLLRDRGDLSRQRTRAPAPRARRPEQRRHFTCWILGHRATLSPKSKTHPHPAPSNRSIAPPPANFHVEKPLDPFETLRRHQRLRALLRSPPAPAPTRSFAPRADPQEQTRIDAEPPAAAFCIRRISTQLRPSLRSLSENGMRLSVFSFVFRQSALGLIARQNLRRQLQRPLVDQTRRRRGLAVDLQPFDPDKPHSRYARSISAASTVASSFSCALTARLKKLRPSSDLPNPPRQLDPSRRTSPA